MRALIVIAAGLLSGCATARVAGFDQAPIGLDSERIDVTGLSGWSSGRFRLGDTQGHVRRDDRRDAIGWGSAAVGDAFDAVRVGQAVRYGTMVFELMRADLGGTLAARCRYAREESRETLGVVDVASESSPLRLACAFRLNGRDAGALMLNAVPTDARDLAERRSGSVTLGDEHLSIRSLHEIAGVRGLCATPAGYRIDAGDGTPVSLIELTAGSNRRVLVARDPARRAAALAAVLTLALFRDPGDVG
ncbi:hypothetical protein SAMN05216382_2334 [Sphingomonas palmae]|uniref:Uncharacterized protein n=1 Tax=Sphingomonas palmae TaxID=1855283 RepID=A0A1H7RRR0_9SPHN|nr:hypothetical protein [Sphingomonas palmae]SEL62893.1 hypothetical protein SAMN05216382_2334 [Sphingomonas palmae]